MPLTQDGRVYYNYEEIHLQLANLAHQIESSVKPDVIIAIGDGGYIPARILRTYLNLPIYCISVKRYDSRDQAGEMRVHQWMEHGHETLRGKNIVVIDEIDDSRATLAYCVKRLMVYQPASLSVGVIHNKQRPKVTAWSEVKSHVKYFAAEDVEDQWIVYPWELTEPLVNTAVAV